jgi:hypothetical protein
VDDDSAPLRTEQSARKRLLARVTRPLAVVLGLALSYYFVQRAGVDRTLALVRAGGIWVPLLVVFQVLVVFTDVLALHALVTDGGTSTAPRVPRQTWFRASAVAYACSMFLPAGRAAGEALRAAALAKTIGAPRAVGAGARLQACSLFGTATACATAAVVALSSSQPLAGLLALNAVVCALLGGAVLLVVRSTRLAAWLRRVLARIVRDEHGDSPSTLASMKAYAFCVLGRAAQTVQYGIAILAVGGRFTFTSALTAQGIQLLGSSIGDLLPGQLGAMEGTYSAFAGALGLSDGPARALSLVLIMRGALIGLALVGLIGAALLPAKPPRDLP